MGGDGRWWEGVESGRLRTLDSVSAWWNSKRSSLPLWSASNFWKTAAVSCVSNARALGVGQKRAEKKDAKVWKGIEGRGRAWKGVGGGRCHLHEALTLLDSDGLQRRHLRHLAHL